MASIEVLNQSITVLQIHEDDYISLNPDFNYGEFATITSQAGLNIAFEFAMWISAEFNIYLIKEFQRLKENESKALDWNVKRSLTQHVITSHLPVIASVAKQSACFTCKPQSEAA